MSVQNHRKKEACFHAPVTRIHRWRRYFAALVLLTISAGCFLGQGKAEAEKTAEAFLEDRMTNGGIGREAFYSEFFWKRNRKENREYLQQMALIALGNLKGYALHSWKARTQTGFRNTGETTVVLIYDTQYQRGKGQEIIMLHKTADVFLISDHQIQAPQLEKLLESGIDLTPQKI